MLLENLNVESSDPVLNDFCNVSNLFSLVEEPTCFKNPDNPSCIDLFLTNRPRSFQNTLTIETGISDFHKMYAYLNKILSKWQCGFRQGYSTQHCLLIMTKKWCQCLDNGG